MTNQQRNDALRSLLLAAQYLTEDQEAWVEHSTHMAVSALQSALSHLGIRDLNADESVHLVLTRIETPNPQG